MTTEPGTGAAVIAVGATIVGGGIFGDLGLTIWGFLGCWVAFLAGVTCQEFLGAAARRKKASAEFRDPNEERGPDYVILLYSFPAGAFVALVSAALIRAISVYHPLGIGTLPDYCIPAFSGGLGWLGFDGVQKLIGGIAGIIQKKTGAP